MTLRFPIPRQSFINPVPRLPSVVPRAVSATPPRSILPKSKVKNLESTSPSDAAFGLSLSSTVI
jgi:hypothetical protein